MHEAPPHMILIMDKLSIRNLIDFWNLRALGLRIIPLVTGIDYADQIIEKNLVYENSLYGNSLVDLHHFKNIDLEFIDAIDSTARKVSEIDTTSRLIDINKFKPEQWRSFRQNNLSRIKDLRCLEVDGCIEFPALKPEFFDELRDEEWGSAILWTNTVKIKAFKANHQFAHVLPIGASGRQNNFGDDRCAPNVSTSEGFVLGASWVKGEYKFRLPTAWTVIKKHFKSQGVVLGRSSAANIVFELLEALGNIQNIKFFGNRDVLNLFEDLAQGLIETESYAEQDQKNNLAFSSSRKKKVHGHTVSYQTLLKTLAASPSATKKFAEDAIEFYTDNGILTIGLRCACEKCTHRNWYQVSQLQNELLCERCLRHFSFPQYPPKESDWEYKTKGVFSQKNFAGGGYAVLLTIRAMTADSATSSTWFPGAETRINGNKMENDLIMLTSNRFARLHDQPAVVIGEVKSFGGCSREIRKLFDWTQAFPDFTILISTLASGFTPEESSLLEEIAIFGRRQGEYFNSRLIMLTGAELLSQELPPYCWKDRDDFNNLLSLFNQSNTINGRPISHIEALAYSTQHIYLGLKHPFDRARRC